ncbi:CRISPR system precrRNA processing endoribonuclease RAMP protein Cas6 [Lachnospiraceae bacterium 46-15]
MKYSVEERFQIPYIRLKFILVLSEDSILPKEKVSALRGGMGEMLLRQNCIGMRDCKNCSFEEACIVRSTVYTRMKRKPAFMQGDDSIGYLLECENYRTDFEAGEELSFYLTLFGNNLVYFGQYLQAFYQLGVNGVGKYHAQYQIKEIRNGREEKILENQTVHMKNYRIETVGAYVEKRIRALKLQGCKSMLTFYTPLCLKFQGEYLREFRSEGIFQAAFRRVMMLDYFVEKYIEKPEFADYPAIVKQNVQEKTVPRYSSNHANKIWMKGIVGQVSFDRIPEEVFPYLAAGELLHIGKNSSFGFGRYRIE